jgi:hypothetical protein
MKFVWMRTISVIAVTSLAVSACQKSENPGASASAPAFSTAPGVTTDPNPPFGLLDTPREGVPVEGGGWGYGWALDDSGVAAVSVSFDGGPAVPAKTGQAFGGVQQAYPNLPGSDRAGFIFAVPRLSSGPHTLTVRIVAKDGGSAELKRQIQIK